MSQADLDGAFVCVSCGKHAAVRGWIHFYPTVQAATLAHGGPEFLGAFLPGPGIFKVEICFGCGRIGLATEYTEKEMKDLEEYGKHQEKRAASGKELNSMIGKFMKKGGA